MTIVSASELAQTALASLTAWAGLDGVELSSPMIDELAVQPAQSVTYLQSVLRWAGDQHTHDEHGDCRYIERDELHDEVLAQATMDLTKLIALLDVVEDARPGETVQQRGERLPRQAIDVIGDLLRLVFAEETCSLEPHLPTDAGLCARSYIGVILHCAYTGIEVASRHVGEEPSHLLNVLGLHTAQMAGEIDRMARRRRTLVCQSTPSDEILRQTVAWCDKIERQGSITDELRRSAASMLADHPVQYVMGALHLLVGIVSEEAGGRGLSLSETVEDLLDTFEDRYGSWRSGALSFMDVFDSIADADTFDTTAECAVGTIADDDPVDVFLLLCAACVALLCGVADLDRGYYDEVVAHAAVHRELLYSRLHLADPRTCETLHAVEGAIEAGCLPSGVLIDDMRDVWFDAILVYAHVAKLALAEIQRPGIAELRTLAAHTAPTWTAVYPSEQRLVDGYLAVLDVYTFLLQDRALDFVDAVGAFVEMEPFESLRLMRDVAVSMLVTLAAQARGAAQSDVLAGYFREVAASAAEPQLTVGL